MIIRRVGPLSCAKIAAALYAVMGLIIGGIFSLVGMAGAFASAADESLGSGFFPAMFGMAAIVVLPIMYACMGFIGTLIAAWLYNVLAGSIGGIELDVQ
jgi:hypothetical protein